MFWEPQRMWKGATVAIIGGGPSLTIDQVRYVRERNCRTIGVNDAFTFGAMIDICFWGDRRWFYGNPQTGHRGHRDGVLAWPGLRVTCCMDCQDEPDVYTMIRDTGLGLSVPPRVKWYANSGWTALGLAVMLGPARIILLGFDGQRVDNKMNWHDDNVSGPGDSVFPHHIASGRECAKDIQEWPASRKPVIFNCTPDSAYDAFPCAPLEEVL